MGSMTLLLAFGAINGFVLAILCAAPARNRTANRFLAGLIGLVSLRLMIYVFGFAGAYDAYPWLTFAPFDVSFAFGPLLWLYVITLSQGDPPSPRWQHFLPAGVQIGYYCVCFALPAGMKWAWYSGSHLNVIEPIATIVVIGSSAGYALAAWIRCRTYQRWLDDNFSNNESWRLGWMRMIITCFAAALLSAMAAAAWNVLVAPLDYFGRTPVMIVFAALAYTLGLLGWRHGDVPYPALRETVEPEVQRESRADYAQLVGRWRTQIEAGGWWREEQLTLAETAKRLAVSQRMLSRGLNAGAATNFNALINSLRVSAVRRAIIDGWSGDLLSLAFECGFASKASFNRAFLFHTGQNPSAWRAAQLSPELRSDVI